MKSKKGQLYYHKKYNKFCIVLKGGKDYSIVNFGNKEVKEIQVNNKDLTRSYAKGEK